MLAEMMATGPAAHPAPSPATPARPAPAPTSATEATAPRPAATRKGAVGAISSAVASMRANAVVELDPNRIRAGGLADRLEDLDAEDAELRRSIAAHGQQVPVLVRPHPEAPEDWQIVYGRRRVLAARDLGIKVKALVRDLDDAALIMAQGQENSARRDLSFIEKVNFARQMVEAGYDRAVIGDALAADKTLVSRMLSVADRIPAEIIGAIGAAHGIGRPRWLELAEQLEARAAKPAQIAALIPGFSAENSAARFEALLTHLKTEAKRDAGRAARPAPKSAAAAAARITDSEGRPLATAKRSGQGGRLSLSFEAADGFDEWLLAELPALHARWKRAGG